MSVIDWLVLCATLALVVFYGLWRARACRSVDSYLLAGQTMPWYAMALSMMATQASAVTFISTTGQSYVDGMRFVQFYFGLPFAMVILAVHRRPAVSPAPKSTRLTNIWSSVSIPRPALLSAVFSSSSAAWPWASASTRPRSCSP